MPLSVLVTVQIRYSKAFEAAQAKMLADKGFQRYIINSSLIIYNL